MKKFIQVVSAALAIEACAADLSAWRGETLFFTFTHVNTSGETIAFKPVTEGLPAGFGVQTGIARPVKFEREPRSAEFLAVRDKIEWNASESAYVPGSERLIVCEIKVPVTAKPGVYKFKTAGEAHTLEVVDRVLPPAKEWEYFLDIWQHPWAVSRWEGCKPFSKEHYAAMRPLWEHLASAGQKVVTTTVTKLPWNHQCYDGYDTMVRHIKLADGSWKFDYSVFDEYVEFCFDCGIGPYIACYSMVPWMYYVYAEDEKGNEIKILAKPGTKEFEDYWKPFLTDFSKHLEAKGWLGRVYISMDERSVQDMKLISSFVRKHAPRLMISTAGNFDPSKYPDIAIDNYSPVLDKVTPEFLANNVPARRNAGALTTYYVCCVPRKPNTFMESRLAESFWCGFFPAAKNLDGFLRWAYNSWPYDPRNDASYGAWRAGDTFFVYPDNQHSCRFLELKNGIQAAEKFRILKKTATGAELAALNALAAEYDYISARKESADLKPLKEKTVRLLNGIDCAPAAFKVDDDLPAGNIIVDAIEGDTVKVQQDLRDSSQWFYWAFRVRGAAGRTLTFDFTNKDKGGPVGVRGPVVSTDGGKTFSYPLDGKSKTDGFTYTFGPGENDVMFYECHPYVRADWDRFVAMHKAHLGKRFAVETLCRSKKGADVPCARFGSIDKTPKFRFFVTARHHCSETMGSWVLEGIAEAFLADDALGDWLRANAELMVVPFVDYDGSQDGDQGKWRKPHDHNRDYCDFIHVETKALTEWIMRHAKGRMHTFIDIHCPWIRDWENEDVYTPLKDPDLIPDAGIEKRFSELLETLQAGSMRYRAKHDIPFGVGWNSNKNYSQGWGALVWMCKKLEGLRIARTFEIPFANASGAVVTPEKCRELGRDIIKVVYVIASEGK